MRSTRAAAALVALASTLLVIPAHAATPNVLRGTTVITADRTSSADFVLYDDATMRVDDSYGSPDISMSGKGRILQFDLSGQGGGMGALRLRRDGRDVLTTSTSGTYYPEQPPCVPPQVPGAWSCSGGPQPTTVLIHQGHYHLRVLTDGAPVTITLHLTGVTGTSRVRTRTPMAGGVVTVPMLNTVNDNYLRFEKSLTFKQSVVATLNVDAKWAPQPRVAGVVWCRYDLTQPALPSDYASYCPAGSTLGGTSYPFVSTLTTNWDPNVMFAQQTAWLDKGAFRLGFSVTSEQKVSVRSALLAWMPQA